MTTEVRPLGNACNIQCQYCYQNPQRDAGAVRRAYDLESIKQAILREGGPFLLFGGEPLLLPKQDLEELWSWGFVKYGSNSIQTNGTLIDDGHILLFNQYNVHVGISIDGPGALNDARWAGTKHATRRATMLSEQAINRLCQNKTPPSIIITLNQANASMKRLPILFAWIERLADLGIRSLRIHLLEVENPTVRNKYALSIKENIKALMDFLTFEKRLMGLKLDLFNDMRQMLLGHDEHVTCIWKNCDPLNTRAVRGIEGDGQRSNCGRTNKDGINFIKANEVTFERYLSLYATPQQYGGCKDCRFFIVCKGHCPGTAIDGDWRNRTEHCEIWNKVYRLLEQDLIAKGLHPLSLDPERVQMEETLIRGWSDGSNISIVQAVQKVYGNKREEPFNWRLELRALKDEVVRNQLNGGYPPS